MRVPRIAAALLAAALAVSPAFAQSNGGGSGGGTGSGGGNVPGDTNERLTGYQCTTPQCDTVRLPDSDCVCRILNPGAKDKAGVRLQCSVPGAGSCPQQPKYSN